MESQALLPTQEFLGELVAGESRFQTSFEISAARDGRLEISELSFPINQETRSLLLLGGNKSSLDLVHLEARAASGSLLKCQAEVIGIRTSSSDADATVTLNLRTVECEIDAPAAKPDFENRSVYLHVKGLRSFGVLRATCPLGEVQLRAPQQIYRMNDVVGSLLVYQSRDELGDPKDWEQSADLLLEHVRRVMSFAMGTVLQCPVIEYYQGERVKILFRATTDQSMGLPFIHFLNLEPIFSVAVRSHFSNPTRSENVQFAIEWLSMSATYDEARLLNAMTALELLISSNLRQDETHLMSARQFNKLRRHIRAEISVQLGVLADLPERADLLTSMSTKLVELNRRSLVEKLEILASNWGVLLTDVGQDRIRLAKRARDHIVHTGLHGTGHGVWEHFTVVRELAARFVFAALGYEGGYISHLGGYNYRSTVPTRPTSAQARSS